MGRWSSLPGWGSHRGRIIWLSGVTAAGLALFALLALQSLDRLRVNGPLYRQIAMGKDLVADVLPPPAYIIESYLTLHRLLDEPDAAARQALIERGRVLAADFEARQAFWATQPLPEGLRQGLLEDAAAPAREFFALRDTALVPALLGGDLPRAVALAQGPLLALYEAHRRAIDEVVEQAGMLVAAQEGEAQALVASRRRWLVFMGVGLAGIVAVLGVAVAGAASPASGRRDAPPGRPAARPGAGNAAGALRAGG